MIVEIQDGEGGDGITARLDIAKLAQLVDEVAVSGLLGGLAVPLCRVGAWLAVVGVGLGDGGEEDDSGVKAMPKLDLDRSW